MWTEKEYKELVENCENNIAALEAQLKSARSLKQFYINAYAAQEAEKSNAKGME